MFCRRWRGLPLPFGTGTSSLVPLLLCDSAENIIVSEIGGKTVIRLIDPLARHIEEVRFASNLYLKGIFTVAYNPKVP